MQLSTNLPQGLKVREHIETCGEERLPMNVSTAANEAYMAEKGIRLKEALTGWPVGTCSRCSDVIHNAPFLSKSEPGEFCSRKCRDLQKRNGGQGTSYTPFQGMLWSQVPRKTRQLTTCSVNCRQKAHRKGDLSPMSQIPKNPPCSLLI
jgi:hypothetical protein